MNKPVLFLIFNRPDYTEQVFQSIRIYKPEKLYIAADGPRLNNQDDLDLCDKSRNIINLVDWDCQVKTLFRDENLGCKVAVASSINWFFDYEEDGIILEDDVVPNQDFFTFCEFSLNKYKDDERVMMITGSNHLSNNNLTTTYFFSQLFNIWGWATWKRAWTLYDLEMKKWNDKQVKSDIKYLTNNDNIWMNYKYTFDSLSTYSMNTWDIQWHFTCLINNGLCVTPKVNLITNIGVIGTHSTKISRSHFLEKYNLGEPENYSFPKTFIVSSHYDKEFHDKFNKKANRHYLLINILSKFKLYTFLKSLKKTLKF